MTTTMRTIMAERPVVIIKLGSSSLVASDGRLDVPFLSVMAKGIAAAVAAGWRPVVVTSGAVASGLGTLGLDQRPAALPDRQALAAIGQIGLAHRWADALAKEGLCAAQILLTDSDFADRRRYVNLTATLRSLFAYNAIPIVNENDTVAVEELTVGDNDRLSALLATQMEARLLVLLTDIDGVYDADPRTNPQAKRQRELKTISASLLAGAGGGGKFGRGGMRSKLEAARLACAAGVTTVIAPARHPNVLAQIIAGGDIGTRIHARAGATSDGRRRWLAATQRPKGRIHVDAGAVTALVAQGRSLLPIGITQVEGRFTRGDTVAIIGPDGSEIARGLSSMDAKEATTAKGLRLDAAAKALGYPLPKAVIHRDNLLVLG
jgi:glutamate 5-kinase